MKYDALADFLEVVSFLQDKKVNEIIFEEVRHENKYSSRYESNSTFRVGVQQ